MIAVAAGLHLSQASAADPVLLHAAGSLRAALTEAAKAYEAASGTPVQTKFGPSGVLREAIAGGEKAEVFASANMAHPQALAAAGKSGPVVLFARNRMCAAARPGLDVNADTLVERMLDPAVKLGTSTPKSDPSGDYAWEIFAKIDAGQPGSMEKLDAKALKLVGGPSSPPTPADRSPVSYYFQEGKADLFLTYCTGRAAIEKEVPGAKVLELPKDIAVAADYGLTVVNGAPPEAYRLAMFILSDAGQKILAENGFSTPYAQ
jgi:molybdenum ABC transporter molybdate-binding protein